MTAADLTPFCSTDPQRPNLHHPWSRGEFSYASNGHIIVKISRLAEVPENQKAPKSTKIFAKLEEQTALAPLPRIETPKSDSADCSYCDGRGTEHDCPNCDCLCAECDGIGEDIPKVSVELNGTHYDSKYLKLLASLPELQFSISPPKRSAGRFVFSGGDGGLMPLNSPHTANIQIKL